jgi:prepilin-type N-terminal cleavage/methylation domain-containing protein
MTANNHSSTRRDRGFSLIELLIVIVVVVSLAALAYSGSRTMITRARIIESSANLRNLAIANTSYLADNGVYCPAI